MFKPQTSTGAHPSLGRWIAAAAVLAVTMCILLTGIPSQPVSASRPDGSAPVVKSSVAPAMAGARGTNALADLTTDVITTGRPLATATPPRTTNPTAAPPEQVSTPDPAQPPAPAPGPPLAPPRPSAANLITDRAMYATEPVNVRDAPGTEGTTVIDALTGNQQVTAGDTVDGWAPVHAGDTYGWVSAAYLTDGIPPAATPPPAAVQSPGNWMTDLVPQVDPTGAAHWVFRRHGAWGASDGHINYIDPNIPPDKRFSVMVHEYSHILQVRVYGSLSASVAALSALIGNDPSDVTANESTADCMALMQGATWINYGCDDSLRSAAAAILAGHRP